MSSSPKKKKKEGASKEIALVKEKKATDVYSDSSEDDAKWDLDEENEPLLNVLACGWLEDGRLGFTADMKEKEDVLEKVSSKIQVNLRPVATLRNKVRRSKERISMGTSKVPIKKTWVGKAISAGSRHSLFLLINCRNENIEDETPEIVVDPEEVWDSDYEEPEPEEKKENIRNPRSKKLLIAGLNQKGLCEEPGLASPLEIQWPWGNTNLRSKTCSRPGTSSRPSTRPGTSQTDASAGGGDSDEEDLGISSSDCPRQICAGYGNSFVTTKKGALISWGHNNFGVLGHGDCDEVIAPRKVLSIDHILRGPFASHRNRIVQVATGNGHTVVLSDINTIYSWGRNHKGQLGLGFESPMELNPTEMTFPKLGGPSHYKIVEITCGFEHCMASLYIQDVNKVNEKSLEEKEDEANVSARFLFVYCWGDASKGQLGSGDVESRHTPQENRWLTRFCKQNKFVLSSIAAGGHHNLALVRRIGNVISWGAGNYGQLGNGLQNDDAIPRLVVGLRDVIEISAGLRHSAALCRNKTDLYMWGYNGYGELGLGDTEMRLVPIMQTSLRRSHIENISCGERHTLVLSSFRAIKAKEDEELQPYFKILEAEGYKKQLVVKIKQTMAKNDIEGDLIDDPEAYLPGQAGSTDAELKSAKFEKGLRYCLDTWNDPMDWRRKGLETCYDCNTPKFKFKAICLACARICMSRQRLVPYVRARSSADLCDCDANGGCVARWSPIRSEFDMMAESDLCIGPNKTRKLLKLLRKPYPIETQDVEECLLAVADGAEEMNLYPRIKPVPFELWYRKYFDEQT